LKSIIVAMIQPCFQFKCADIYIKSNLASKILRATSTNMSNAKSKLIKLIEVSIVNK
jgi:hypothetical protein